MSKSALLELAERVENASGPKAGLIIKIKLAVAASLFASGASKDHVVRIVGGDLYATPLPYMSSLDAAATLIPLGFSYALGDLNQENLPWACVTSPDGVDFNSDGALTPVCCLTAACLRARANQEKTDAQ